MSSRDIKVSLPTWLGVLVHESITIYLENKKSGTFQKKPLLPIKAHLRVKFANLRSKYNISPHEKYLHDGWNEKQITQWVYACIHAFQEFLNRENISWFKHEWPLKNIQLNGRNCLYKDLGQPDFFCYSNKQKRYLLIDIKTQFLGAQHYVCKGKICPLFREKLIKYAAGIKAKAKSTNGRNIKKLDIGLFVFIKQKVKPKKPLSYELVLEPIGRRRLSKVCKSFFPHTSGNLQPVNLEKGLA